MRGYGRQKKNEKKEKLNRVWPAKISLYPIPNLYFLLLYPIPNLYVILLCLILSLYFRMLISAYSHNRTKASINFRFKRFLHYCTFFSFFKNLARFRLFFEAVWSPAKYFIFFVGSCLTISSIELSLILLVWR